MRSPVEHPPHLRPRLSLPLEGKGDRSAVDEVTCRLAPLREASNKIEEHGGFPAVLFQ